MAYIKIDETKRITAASYDFHCGDNEIEVVIPEDIQSLEDIHNYLYDSGEFIYDPLAETEVTYEEKSTNEELENKIKSQQAEIDYLKAELLALKEMLA